MSKPKTVDEFLESIRQHNVAELSRRDDMPVSDGVIHGDLITIIESCRKQRNSDSGSDVVLSAHEWDRIEEALTKFMRSCYLDELVKLSQELGLYK